MFSEFFFTHNKIVILKYMITFFRRIINRKMKMMRLLMLLMVNLFLHHPKERHFMPIHSWSSIYLDLCFAHVRCWATQNPRQFRFKLYLHCFSNLIINSSNEFIFCCVYMFGQAAGIPIALTGRDICGSAITGSGKVFYLLNP